MKDKEVNVKQNSLIVSHQHSFVVLHSPVGAKHPNVSHQQLPKKAGSSLAPFPTTKICSLAAVSSSPKMPQPVPWEKNVLRNFFGNQKDQL